MHSNSLEAFSVISHGAFYVVFSQTYLAEPVQAGTPRSAAQDPDWDTQPGAHWYPQVVGVPLTFHCRGGHPHGTELVEGTIFFPRNSPVLCRCSCFLRFDLEFFKILVFRGHLLVIMIIYVYL